MKQRLILRTADRKLFIDELIRLGAEGAIQAPDSVPSFGVVFTAEVLVEVERGSERFSTQNVYAVPLPIDVYTREQMEEMVWEEFREACQAFGVKGRERSVMLEQYIRKSEDYLKLRR